MTEGEKLCAEADLVLGLAPESLLGRFNRAGVLSAADVHVALALDRLSGQADALVELAVALAVRATRTGHVLADLVTAPMTVLASSEAGETSEAGAGVEELPWPQPSTWLGRVADSMLVSTPGAAHSERPLRLEGSALYLQRYWRDECSVAAELLRRAGTPLVALDEVPLDATSKRLFPDDRSGLQREAAVRSVRSLLSVVAGGPGTGKTTTIARFLALAHDQVVSEGKEAPLVALSAPTGKAAAKVAEAVREQARSLPIGQEVREWMEGLDAFTVDRLLGRHPGSAGRFRHDRQNQLPHDIVVVDETSMMSLPLMASLLEALRPDARLVLVGDPEQLASVEAGAVLADIVGPLAAGPSSKAKGPMGQCVTVLTENHRFKGALAEVAAAARAGDADGVLAALNHPLGEGASWVELDPTTSGAESFEAVKNVVGKKVEALAERGAQGDALGAIEALGSFRLLCAHRDGAAGASTWNALIERWLATLCPSQPTASWYPGRPVVVTENDYSLGLWNGDLGVAVRAGDRTVVAFQRASSLIEVSPSRLTSVQTAFAMTAHRAQGSEFDEVVFVLPPAPARVLTRELFYTALTRARRSVTVVGTEEAVRFAVSRPVARASGLAARLWEASGWEASSWEASSWEASP